MAKDSIARNRPGTKSEDFSNWPSVEIENNDSAFSFQEYIQSLIRRSRTHENFEDPKVSDVRGVRNFEDDDETIHGKDDYSADGGETVDGGGEVIDRKDSDTAESSGQNSISNLSWRANTRPTVQDLVETPKDQDPDLWQYEHLRQLCLELNQLIAQLIHVCTADTCPEMRALEWLYMCAAHTVPQACCAIDYSIHTLDGATAVLNNNRHFPSRVSVPETSLRHFQSIARRLYRIFAHAWFHHREVFDTFEFETELYARFEALSKHYGLIPKSLLIIDINRAEQSSEDNTRRGIS